MMTHWQVIPWLFAAGGLLATTTLGQVADVQSATQAQAAGLRRAEALLAEMSSASFIPDVDQREAAQRQSLERVAAELQKVLAAQASLGRTDYSSAVVSALIASQEAPPDQLQRTDLESHPDWIRLDLATRWPAGLQSQLPAEQIETYRQTCEQRAKLLGNEHWWTRLGKLDHASALLRSGRQSDAEPVLRELAKDVEGQDGITEQRLATAVAVRPWAGSLLAQTLFLQGKEAAALQVLEDAGESDSALASLLRVRRGSDEPREQAAFAFGHNQIAGIGGPGSSLSNQELAAEASRRNRINLYLNALVELGPRSAEALDLGSEYEWGLASWKGAVFDEQRRIYAERRHPTLRPLFDQLDGVKTRLAALPAGAEAARRGELLAAEQSLLSEISRGRDRLPKMLPRPPTQQLPEGAVLLDFYEYERIVPQAGETPLLEPRLLCFIGRPPPTHAMESPVPPQHVKVVDLGNRKPIREALDAWRIALRSGEGGLSARKPQALDEQSLAALPQGRLYNLLWRPLAEHVESANLIVIIPDGDLWFLPFGALSVQEENRYLIEQANIVIAAHPRMLEHYASMTEAQARYQTIAGFEARPSAAHMLLVGNIDYTPAATPNGDAPDKIAAKPIEFQPLPGTKAEIDSLAALSRQSFPETQVVVLQQRDPTESAVRERAASARYVHFATHGFLQEDPVKRQRLSALALAGVNSQQGLNDGVITSLEGSTFDLNAAELVVLSACETGLGTPVQGEGLAGLQSMLHLAGARSIVSSLWQVDDRATQVLMVEFYRNLWQRKQNKAEALRNAQLAMLRGELNAELRRRSPTAADSRASLGRGLEPVLADQSNEKRPLPPFYWAAFLLSGDWR